MDLSTILEEFKPKEGGGGFKKVNFLSLKDDGDTAKVKILIKDEKDLEKYVNIVHEFKIGKFPNKIKCLGDECECCKSGLPRKVKIHIPIYNFETNQVEVWERGYGYIQYFVNLIEDYGNLQDYMFRITRNGARGSKQTKYDIIPLPEKQNKPLPDGVENDIPQIVGRDFKLVMNLTPTQQVEGMTTGKVDFSTSSKESTEDTDEIPF